MQILNEVTTHLAQCLYEPPSLCFSGARSKIKCSLDWAFLTTGGMEHGCRCPDVTVCKGGARQVCKGERSGGHESRVLPPPTPSQTQPRMGLRCKNQTSHFVSIAGLGRQPRSSCHPFSSPPLASRSSVTTQLPAAEALDLPALETGLMGTSPNRLSCLCPSHRGWCRGSVHR